MDRPPLRCLPGFLLLEPGLADVMPASPAAAMLAQDDPTNAGCASAPHPCTCNAAIYYLNPTRTQVFVFHIYICIGRKVELGQTHRTSVEHFYKHLKTDLTGHGRGLEAVLLAARGGCHRTLIGLPGWAEQGRRLQPCVVKRRCGGRGAGACAARVGQPCLEAGHLPR